MGFIVCTVRQLGLLYCFPLYPASLSKLDKMCAINYNASAMPIRIVVRWQYEMILLYVKTTYVHVHRYGSRLHGFGRLGK